MQPVEARWDDSVKSSPLFDYNCFWHISMIIELLLEMAIFSLPAREVSKLEFDNSKIVLAAITALFGAVVIATGILRLYTFWSKGPYTLPCDEQNRCHTINYRSAP